MAAHGVYDCVFGGVVDFCDAEVEIGWKGSSAVYSGEDGDLVFSCSEEVRKEVFA